MIQQMQHINDFPRTWPSQVLSLRPFKCLIRVIMTALYIMHDLIAPDSRCRFHRWFVNNCLHKLTATECKPTSSVYLSQSCTAWRVCEVLTIGMFHLATLQCYWLIITALTHPAKVESAESPDSKFQNAPELTCKFDDHSHRQFWWDSWHNYTLDLALDMRESSLYCAAMTLLCFARKTSLLEISDCVRIQLSGFVKLTGWCCYSQPVASNASLPLLIDESDSTYLCSRKPDHSTWSTYFLARYPVRKSRYCGQWCWIRWTCGTEKHQARGLEVHGNQTEISYSRLCCMPDRKTSSVQKIVSFLRENRRQELWRRALSRHWGETRSDLGSTSASWNSFSLNFSCICVGLTWVALEWYQGEVHW